MPQGNTHTHTSSMKLKKYHFIKNKFIHRLSTHTHVHEHVCVCVKSTSIFIHWVVVSSAVPAPSEATTSPGPSPPLLSGPSLSISQDVGDAWKLSQHATTRPELMLLKTALGLPIKTPRQDLTSELFWFRRTAMRPSPETTTSRTTRLSFIMIRFLRT